MKINKRILSVALMILPLWTAVSAAVYKKGDTIHGFQLLDSRFVREVNAECFYFRHVKSGAHLLKIAAADSNKTFSIAFKTVPESDVGTPHIMEHSVLNGSRHFPVKSPFDVLSKGSLHTFLNAMTGSDITIYPVASMNDKDYFNLMHVYLDAVFQPLIYSDPRILKQEGWHREMEKKDGPIVYKGVVYNEMKGAYSSPTRELEYQVYKNLFPDNGYGFSSGGYPASIPRLTYDAFIRFHRRYYHPSNSYIFLYGDADMEKELAFIDTQYLSGFVKSDARVDIPLQKPFAAMKEVTAPYPVTEGSKTGNQTYLTLSVVAGRNTDRALVMALDVLSDVLVNQESAPVRLALQAEGIGRDVSASVDDIQQNVFEITVQNANATDKEKFRDVIMKTLRDVARVGLDKQAVEGTLNRLEFRLREGNDAQKGLKYNMQAMTGWFFADDPFLGLEYEKPLALVKTALTGSYLESVMKNSIIDNPHALLLVLEPKPGMEKENNGKIEEELRTFKASLSEKAVESLVRDTKELVAYQKREDSPQALASIPMLNLKDIDPKADWYVADEVRMSGMRVLPYDTFTNGVMYVRLSFDARVLPVELIPYSALLAEVLGSLNTRNYSFGDLDKALNIHTGGFSTLLDTYLERQDDANLRPAFVVASKAVKNKSGKLFELAGEIVNHTRFGDADRLKAVLARHQSRLEANIKQNGFGYARTRLGSYLTKKGMFDELTGGIEYYWFVTDLANHFDQKSKEIGDNLARTASLLFNRENCTVSVTCEKADLPAFSDGLKSFAPSLPAGSPEYRQWTFDLQKKNEGLLAASKVQYVIEGSDFKKLGYAWDGRMRVLEQILSSDWLQTRIRVVGGAYGGFCAFSPSGRVFFASYRDPNLKETLDNYAATPDYLARFEADEKTMTRYIIGTVAKMDRPLTPAEKGNLAVRRFLEKSTPGELQHERDAVLAATPQDIRAMRQMVADILAQKAICVYGNEDKIRAQKELFGELVKLTR